MAGFLGACAAGVQVGRLGTTVVSASDLRGAIARLHTSHLAYAPEQLGTACSIGQRETGLAPKPRLVTVAHAEQAAWEEAG